MNVSTSIHNVVKIKFKKPRVHADRADPFEARDIEFTDVDGNTVTVTAFVYEGETLAIDNEWGDQ